MTTFLLVLYILALSGLGVFGFLGYITLWYYWLHRGDPTPNLSLPEGEALPIVTIQLPVFNERYVIGRLVQAATSLSYPKEKLEIQIVDDSTDETAALAEELTTHYRHLGFNISLFHRSNRQGFKAGALAAALEEAQGEFVAIFDADFQPQTTFLQKTIPLFLAEPNLGMVQTRWGHLNDQRSPLTAAQAIAMDKHFMIEQTVRHRADLYPKFNGTAGIWRRSCIEDAGGWLADTVCEDLCLSTRAVLNGWDFQFLPDVVTPGELPTSISAYKNQQARWAKGSLQCLIKFGWQILTDHQHSWIARFYALLTMSGYLAHPFLLTLILLQIPLMLLGYPLSPKLFLFSVLGLGQPVLFIISQQLIYPDWPQRLRHFPTLMLISLGLGPSITRAVLQIFTSSTHNFVRTPKGEEAAVRQARQTGTLRRHLDGYRFPFDPIVTAELFLAAYGAIGLWMAVSQGIYGPIFLLSFCFIGFSYASYLSLSE
ncbi:MAG: glycosyltransferase [Ardenticatenaceae bacterium]|nr:glycosyltransferase [Ardenticatenaceae bacterium]